VEHKLLDVFEWVLRSGFKIYVLVGEVGLNFYTMLDEASLKETRPFGARLAFRSMRDTLLPAHLPCQ
jgi:hypothetical protein